MTTNDRFNDLDELLREALAEDAARRALREGPLRRMGLDKVRNYIRQDERGGSIIGPAGCFTCGGQHLTRDCETEETR